MILLVGVGCFGKIISSKHEKVFKLYIFYVYMYSSKSKYLICKTLFCHAKSAFGTREFTQKFKTPT